MSTEDVSAERSADPNEAERTAFYDAYDAHTRNTGHKPAPFDVWLMARGLMDSSGRRRASSAAAVPATDAGPFLQTR